MVYKDWTAYPAAGGEFYIYPYFIASTTQIIRGVFGWYQSFRKDEMKFMSLDVFVDMAGHPKKPPKGWQSRMIASAFESEVLPRLTHIQWEE